MESSLNNEVISLCSMCGFGKRDIAMKCFVCGNKTDTIGVLKKEEEWKCD